MVLNTIFNNISIISWQSVLFVAEVEVPGENHQTAISWIYNSKKTIKLVFVASPLSRQH